MDRLLEHLPDGVLLVEDRVVLTATGRAAEVLGISVRRLVGSVVVEILPRGADAVLERVGDGASSCTIRGLSWDRPSAAKRITVTGTPGPQPGQVVLVVRGAPEAAGHTAAEGFRRRLAWLDTLAAGMAHEIRNPLGGIRGAAQLLRRDPDPGDHDELTALIIQEADRIDSIVERLMQLVRPRRLQRAQVSLNRLVHDEVALLRARFGRDPVEWELDLDPSLPLLEGDPDRLREAVGNLLRNAQEAARSTVCVRTRTDGEGRLAQRGFDRGISLRFDVTDDGEGIDPERLPTLFDPFATTKPEGTGLGLFVTRLAIEEHLGLLDVDPRPGLGARFTLVLSQNLPPTAGLSSVDEAQTEEAAAGRGPTDASTPSLQEPLR